MLLGYVSYTFRIRKELILKEPLLPVDVSSEPHEIWSEAEIPAHIAYCVPLLKIADFLTAGVNVSLLCQIEIKLTSR